MVSHVQKSLHQLKAEAMHWRGIIYRYTVLL